MSDKNKKLLRLTPEQEKAINAPAKGRIKIVAGAGSGKTEVLTQRIAALINNGVPPAQLAAITYTQKAAAEMKNRLADRDLIEKSQLREIDVSTFHAFLLKILKTDPYAVGIDTSEAIISETDKALLIVEILEDFAKLYGKEVIHGENAIEAITVSKLLNEFPAALSKIRRYIMTPSEFYQFSRKEFNKHPDGPDTLEKNMLEWLFKYYTYYLQKLKTKGFLDFDEILIKGKEYVLNKVELSESLIKNVFLIDEFQDNNFEQIELIEAFCKSKDSHITVVGDEKQSIYRFQGANLESIKKFKTTEEIILHDNFRSYYEIVRFADLFLESNPNIPMYFEHQLSKRGCAPHPPAVVCFNQDIAESKDPNENEKAVFLEVVKMIDAMIKKGITTQDRDSERALTYGDFAIIVPSIRHLGSGLEDALINYEIPYIMSGGWSFYARTEVNELLAFLRLLIYPEDDYSLVKILTGPHYGLLDSELASLSADTRKLNTSLLAHIFCLPIDKLPQKAIEFREIFIELQKKRLKCSLLELCHTIVEQGGYYEYAALQKSKIKSSRMHNNITKFLSIVRTFQKNEIFTSIGDFLYYIDRILQSDIVEDEAGLGLEEGEAIKILTIHKSKGLEFSVVICPNTRRRTQQATSRIIFDKNWGLIVRDPSVSPSDASEKYKDYYEAEKAALLEEEQRKLYVAFSRAKDYLIISGVDNTKDKGETYEPAPMRLVQKILNENPKLGIIDNLSNWSQVVDEWAQYGTMPPVSKPSIESKAGDPKDAKHLADSLKAIVDFNVTKHTEQKKQATELDIFSLDSLNLFKQCPKKYFFANNRVSSFIKYLPSFSATLGTLVHETIRIYHNRKAELNESETVQREIIYNILDTLLPLYGAQAKKTKGLAIKILNQYLSSPLSKTKPWLTEAEVNVKFESEGEEFYVRGFADRVDKTSEGIQIYDFKTMTYSEEKHEQFSNQMGLYYYASQVGVLGELGSLNFSEASIVYLTPYNYKIVPSNISIDEFEKHILSTVQEIRSQNEWLPKPSEACRDCGFSILCDQTLTFTEEQESFEF